MDKGHIALLFSLALSAAFDTIDQQILISRLTSRIGVRGVALQWFTSYLADWSTKVEINGKSSLSSMSSVGLPQGSVFGPIGYTIYTLPVGDIARRHQVFYHTYADDIQLYITFDPKKTSSQDAALKTLSACVADIRAWMSLNKLKLNEDKTEFLVIGSVHNLRRLENVILNVGATSSIPSKSARNLGAYFDCNMSMSEQEIHLCKSDRFHLRSISKIRKCMTEDACHSAVRCHILSRLDYYTVF